MNSYSFFSQTQPPYTYSDGKLHHHDPLTIYDGSNDQSNQIEKLSGNLGSFVISSTGNSLFVKFESDDFYTVYTGFLATIQYGNAYLNIKYHIKNIVGML